MAHPDCTKGPMLNANGRSAYVEYRLAMYIYMYVFKYMFIYTPNSKFGLTLMVLPSLSLKEPDLSGSIRTSASHFTWELLDLPD
jgi:hypothetical protein